jgi:hypothetical protein
VTKEIDKSDIKVVLSLIRSLWEFSYTSTLRKKQNLWRYVSQIVIIGFDINLI